MISDQIIEEYLEQESELAAKVVKFKLTLLLFSVIGLLFFSI